MHFFETTEICFGSIKMEISTGKESISHWEKLGKVISPPPKKIFLLRLWSSRHDEEIDSAA